MSDMKYSDAAGFICADCSNIDLGQCDVSRALEEFDRAPWARELEKFESLDGKRPTPCWPDLTYRIGKYHIGFMLESDLTTFRVEVCTPPKKRLFGIFNCTKFFQFNHVQPSQAKEYLEVFYTLSYSEQREYYALQT